MLAHQKFASNSPWPYDNIRLTRLKSVNNLLRMTITETQMSLRGGQDISTSPKADNTPSKCVLSLVLQIKCKHAKYAKAMCKHMIKACSKLPPSNPQPDDAVASCGSHNNNTTTQGKAELESSAR
jgi:hypothetical protein